MNGPAMAWSLWFRSQRGNHSKLIPGAVVWPWWYTGGEHPRWAWGEEEYADRPELLRRGLCPWGA